MWLDEWLFKEKTKVTELAVKLEISRTYMNLIVLKKRRAGTRLAKDIEALTEGKVTAKALRNVKIDKEKK